MGSAGEEPALFASGRVARSRRDLVPLYAMTAVLVCAAGGWYLLKELAPLLRPLTMAVFLAYMIRPVHQSLRRWVPANVAGLLLFLIVAALVLGLAMLVYGNLVELKAELPRLIERGQGMIERLRSWGRSHLPAWALAPAPDAARTEAETATQLKALASHLVNIAAGCLAEALVVLFYLIFLLLDARRFPARVRAGFRPEQADHVLGILGSVNRAMASYLRVKALSSLVTALPVVAILWAFGVPFPGMWGVLLLVLVQLLTNNFVEPRLTARAVDLSPLAVLVALAFWGLCWGAVGMVLAVPLTVMLKIVCENTELTRPLARLMAEE
jgi:AI-2 transport protein TqsA